MRARGYRIYRVIAPFAALALEGCATLAAQPAADGAPVPLDRPVRVGRLQVTPRQVAEDSRCPPAVQCVWAGRVVLRTRIEGAGWREDASLTLGQPHTVHGTTITLVGVEPQKRKGSAIPPGEYRFAFAGGL